MDSAHRPRIGELLVQSGHVSQEAVDRALAAQTQLGGVIGEHLVSQGAVDERLLMKALSRQTGLQHVNLFKTAIAAEVQRLVHLETARHCRVLPVAIEGRTLVLGMVNPQDLAAERRVIEETHLSVRPVLLSASQHEGALARASGSGWGEAPLLLESSAPLSAAPPAGRDLPSLLEAMVKMGGQDLFLTEGAIPSVRVDNELVRLSLDPMTSAELSELVLSSLTPTQRESFERRLELDFAWLLPRVGRFRCNVYRQRGSVSFTARYVRDRIPSHDELGLPSFLREVALRKQGFVLIVGPTGHGKTTTLACMVDQINRERRANVITIEDPIEYVHHHRASNVNQREVGTDTRSFAEGLRHAFRQSPDVLVIGEMRDLESASIALTAAETGHLVLATMHANNATAAVDRIVDLFPAEQQHQVRAQLSESLLIVFSQRLLRRANGKGRALAFERMSACLQVKNALREGRPHALRALMQTNLPELSSIDQSLASLVASGQVARDEAMKYCDQPSYLDDLVRVKTGRPVG